MKRPLGVYRDRSGEWYFKVDLGRDSITGKRRQITRRGFATAADASRARREYDDKPRDEVVAVLDSSAVTVNELLDIYLAGSEADGQLAPKTRFDAADRAKHYVRPVIGHMKVLDVTPKVILEWQRHLATRGGAKNGKPLAPNTIRLARNVLSGAFKTGQLQGLVTTNPLIGVPQPKRPAGSKTPCDRPNSAPAYWPPRPAAPAVRGGSPEQASPTGVPARRRAPLIRGESRDQHLRAPHGRPIP